jgi:hypothetical protein
VWPPDSSYYDWYGGDNVSEIDRGEVASLIVDPSNKMHLLKLNIFTGAYTLTNLHDMFGKRFLAQYSGVVCPKKGTLVLGLYRYIAFDPTNRTEFYRSTDNGASWSLISPQPPYDSFVYGSFQGVPLFLVSSTDGGATWTSGAMSPEFNPHYVSPYLGGDTPVFYTYAKAPPAVQYGWDAANALGNVPITLKVYKDHRLTEQAWEIPLGTGNFDQAAYDAVIFETVVRHYGPGYPLRPGHPGFLEN